MTNRFDVIVIGAGNAGFAAAGIAHQAGLSVAMVESDTFGGTCPNRGCTPKKVLVAAAHTLEYIRRAHHHGIQVAEPTLDWAHLIEREQEMIAHIPDAMYQAAQKFTTFRGEASFVGPREIDVEGTRLGADHIVIATGSTPRPLNIPGHHLLVTSDDLLTNRQLPPSLVFVGGGVIALEFAHVFARAGTHVTILEALPQLLPNMDADAVAVLHQATESLGIDVITGVSVDEITQDASALRVIYRTDAGRREIITQRVVNGTGRVPNVAHLNLSAGEIEHRQHSVTTDAFCRSISNPAVWVVGDALTTTAQLSPLATREGRQIGQYITQGVPQKASTEVTPQAVHTVPPLASVGLTERQAQQLYPQLTVQSTDMKGWFSSRSFAEETAWAKVLVDAATDQIVGAHLIGHRGDDLIHLFALAINHSISAASLRNAPFAFPTFSSDIKNL